MNPSFWDASRIAACPACEVKTRVDEGLLHRALRKRQSLLANVRCWHCGESISAAQIRDWLALPGCRPDIVCVADGPVEDLEAGDVVLISKAGDFHLKRIFATPGQSVTTDGAGRLLADQQRPCFPSMPTIMVDRDPHRETSRWRSYNASGPTTPWVRTEDRQWTTSAPSDWLIYEHHSVYRGNQPAPVLDDYPGNIAIARKLSHAEGLSVQFRVLIEPSDSQRHVKTKVAFWRDEKVVTKDFVHEIPPLCTELVIERSCTKLDCESKTSPLSPDLPPLSWTRPVGVALRMEDFDGSTASHLFSCRICDLAVDRQVLYRSHLHVGRSPDDAPSLVPSLLAGDEWFVVGDNVPLSVDSRNWGSVHTHEIIGRVDE